MSNVISERARPGPDGVYRDQANAKVNDRGGVSPAPIPTRSERQGRSRRGGVRSFAAHDAFAPRK